MNEPQEGPAAWRWWQALGGLITAFIGASILGAMVFAIGASFSGSIKNPAPGSYMVGLLVQDLCFIGFAVMFAGMRGGSPRPWMFGLRRPENPKRAIGELLVVYLIVFIVSAIVSTFVDIDGSKVADDLGVRDSTAAAIGGAFLVAVLAPIAEEFLFRGFVFPCLRPSLRTGGAAIVTGLLFGAVHLGSSPAGAIIPLVIFGGLLCLLYVRTGSLLPGIVLHCLNNSIAYASLVHWDWQVPVMFVACLSVILLVFRGTEAVFGRAPLHLSSV